MSALLRSDLPTVELGGLKLSELDDLTGVEWYVTNLEGWDGAAVRRAGVELPDEHGEYDVDPLYGSKSMAIEGAIFAESEQELQRARLALARATADLTPKVLIVHEQSIGLSRQCSVRRAGAPTFARAGLSSFLYSLPLVASDPRRYDVAERAATVGLPATSVTGAAFPLSFPFGFGTPNAGTGDVVVVNDGDVYTWPTFVISGPVNNPVIRNNTTGEQLTIALDLAYNQSLVIDSRDRTILLDGTASRRGALVVGSTWPRFAPGENLIQFRGASATVVADTYGDGYSDTYGNSAPPLVTISHRSAWA